MGVYEHATNDTSQVLLDDPELAQNLRGDRLAAATRDCTARAINVPVGPWMPPDQVDSMRFGIGLLRYGC